jgi:hypothetical protein
VTTWGLLVIAIKRGGRPTAEPPQAMHERPGPLLSVAQTLYLPRLRVHGRATDVGLDPVPSANHQQLTQAVLLRGLGAPCGGRTRDVQPSSRAE